MTQKTEKSIKNKGDKRENMQMEMRRENSQSSREYLDRHLDNSNMPSAPSLIPISSIFLCC